MGRTYRKINSSQKGFENIAEGTQYDDYHIDTKGMGILSVENIIEEIEGRGNQAVLTVQTSDGSTNHSQFGSNDWKEYKDSVNNAGNAITDVWVTEVEGGSYVRNSRRPIKSSLIGEDIGMTSFAYNTTIVGKSSNGKYKIWKELGSDSFILTEDGIIKDIASEEEVREEPVIENWSEIYNIKTDKSKYVSHSDFYMTNSRRPIKSGWVFISSIGDANIFEENNKYLVTLEKGANTVEEYFDDEASARDFAKEITSSFIHSARYIATDPETGEVLGSADTYEEAVNEWGEDVTITDSEAAEGQEDMGLFQSRKPVNSGMQHKDISNVSPDSWRDGSELPKKNFSNMSIEVFNQDGDEVFYDFEAKQWYYYPTHRKALVKKWVEKKFVNSSRKITSSYQTAINELEEYFERSGSGNDDEYTIYTRTLSRDDENHIAKICEDNDCDFAIGTSHVTIYPIESSRKITSAVDGGWEVRSSDVPKALDLFVEYFGEENALEEIAKAMGDNVLEENIDWIAQQWGFAEDIEELDDAWDKYETAKEIMGESELFNNLTKAAGYDELAEDLAFIFRMNDFREWDKYDNEDDEEIESSHKIASANSNKEKAKELWAEFEDVPINDDDEIEEDFLHFESGTDRFEIWKWFEEKFGVSIEDDLMYDEDNEITNNRLFPVKTVKNILSGKWTEERAAQNIAEKQNINVGYAKQILSSWIEQYKPKLIKSGILDIAEDINTEFDIDGDLESWAEQYTNNSGKSNTVGGEMVRAAMQIIYHYNNDGDMIGRGYGNETVNAAARYITEKAEMGVNEQIQKWLDHEERADDYDYDNFIETFTTEIEQILRENPELFQKPNKDDYWDWKEDEDMDYGLDECYLDDGNGNQYWFQLDNDRWTCTGIELDPNAVTYSEGDTINEGDEYSDEIDHTEEFGSFEADGFIYEYAGDDWDDDREEYTSWQITKVVPQDPYCDEGDTLDFYDLEPDELYGFRLFDHNGNEVDERTFLASSLIKSRFGAGSECVIEIDRHKNNKWEMVAESDDERGWTLNGTAKMFADKNEAKNSDLMKALERSGYSINKGNLKISEA